MANESRFRQIEDMAWPDPRALGELAWRLTFSPSTVTREDQLLLASVCGAYRQMIADGRQKRERVCQVLRRPAAPEQKESE